MRGSARRRATAKDALAQRQINVRVSPAVYRTLEAMAREERRSVPQVVRHLIEDGMRQRVRGGMVAEETPPWEVARLADAGGAFDWLADEPDLYDDRSGEPV